MDLQNDSPTILKTIIIKILQRGFRKKKKEK